MRIAGGPARLLLFVGGQLRRNLPRHFDIGQEERAPAGHLRAVAEVEVFGEGIGGPAAGLFDATPPPNAARAIEGDEPAAAIARRLLDHKMRINGQLLRAGQAVLVGVEVPPAALRDAHGRVRQQMRQQAPQEIGRGDEIGVEDGDVFAVALLDARGQGAGFEAIAIATPQMLRLIAAGAQLGQLARDEQP